MTQQTTSSIFHEMELRAKALAFDALFKDVQISFYWTDRTGKMLGCNDYEFEILKLPAEKIIGQYIYNISSQQAWLNSQQVMETEESLIAEEVHHQGQPDELIFLSIKSPVFDEQKNVTGLIGVSANITHMKKQEQVLIRAKNEIERTKELRTAFIQNMEHDIRTPSSGIYGMTNMMASMETDPEKKEALELVAKASKRLLDYCNGVLDFRGLSSGQLPLNTTSFDGQELLTSVIELELPAARYKNLNLISYYAEQLPKMLISDEHRIHRILINLISNAIKFTKEGEIKAAMNMARPIDHQTIMLQISITDTGQGIPKDKHAVIFEQFVRLVPANKELYKGHGLGLTVVKQFMKELNGEIQVESVVNQGTTIHCFIPVKIWLD